jgi:hypothetical protein
MPAWWDSVQQLSDINTWLRAAVAVTTLLSAGIAGGLWRVGARINELQGHENQKTQERIATANNNAQQAILGQKSLEEKTAEAELQQERLKKENLQLQINLEKERLARLKIEERLAPRNISPEQATRLAIDLEALHGKKVTVAFISGVPETAAFAGLLASKLRAAGLLVDPPTPMLLLGNVNPGITVVIGAHRLGDADTLAHALVDAGLASAPVPATKDDNNAETLQITIGPKT